MVRKMNKDINTTVLCTTSKIGNIELEIDKQNASLCEYVSSNELHVKSIEDKLRDLESSLEHKIHNLVVSVIVLSAGLFSCGIALFALIYHLLTM